MLFRNKKDVHVMQVLQFMNKEKAMKKRITIVAVLLLAAFVYAQTRVVPVDTAGKRVDPGSLHTPRDRWVVLDTTSSTGTEPSDIDVDTRGSGGDVTYQQVKTLIAAAANGDDEISVFDVPRSWNGARFRAIGITDNGTATYQIYAGTLGDGNRDIDSTAADCELAYIGQFVFTIGAQASVTSTYEMADTLIHTASDWTKSATVASPVGNRVAEGRIDLIGADVLILVPTTVTADCKLLARGF